MERSDARFLEHQTGQLRIGTITARIEQSGLLVREGGGFQLQSDNGVRWRLELHRTPVDQVEKRVHLIGTLISDDVIAVEAMVLAGPAT